MTEKEKAEAYVREQRPALMELSEGCVVKVGEYTYALDSNWKIETREYAHVNEYRVITNSFNEWTKIDEDNFTIIGHPIKLNDWLAVLRQSIEYSHHYHMYLDGGVAKLIAWKNGTDEPLFTFNMETGQPATEADYQAFNEIVSV